MSVDALRAMGNARHAGGAGGRRFFREREQATLPELAAVYDGDRKVFVSAARRHIQNLANLFKADATRRDGAHHDADRGWEGPPRAGQLG